MILGRRAAGGAAAILDATIESGITMVDTADVYGQGRSEHLIGDFLARLSEARRSQVLVATKMGRDGPQDPDEFHLDNYRRWTDASRKRLGVEGLDLVQLHSPPDEVFGRQQVWDDLETLVTEGGVRAYGVSVETVTQALRVVDRPTLASVQVILKIRSASSRWRNCCPHVFITTSPCSLGSRSLGPSSGRFDRSTQFSQDDHRYYNRDGQSFDVGETFSGVPFDVGVDAASEFAQLRPARINRRPVRVAVGAGPTWGHLRDPGRVYGGATPRQRQRRG